VSGSFRIVVANGLLCVSTVLGLYALDGAIYAFDATDGHLLWRYQTAGPVQFSAAYKIGVVYIASNESEGVGKKLSLRRKFF